MSGPFRFAALFLGTDLVFGAIVAAWLLGRNDRLRLPAWPLVLTGIGLAPLLTTLVLYYPLVLWHNIPAVLLQVLPVLFFGAMALRCGPGWGRLMELFRTAPRLLGDRSMWPFLLGSVLLVGVAALLLMNKPLVDHDILEYAVQGRIFLRERAIVYERFHHDAATGFHYVGLHGFSFPLLFTWEGLWGALGARPSDLWVRSQTLWYGWLLIALVWSLVRRVDRWAAVGTGIALTVPLGFLFLLTIYHLDSYRIFLFTAMFAAFAALLHTPSRERLLLFAVLAGGQAFIHSVGAILGGLLCTTLLLALPMRPMARAAWTVTAAGVMLAAGAVHYVIDVLFGTGWILQDIIWY